MYAVHRSVAKTFIKGRWKEIKFYCTCKPPVAQTSIAQTLTPACVDSHQQCETNPASARGEPKTKNFEF